MLFLDLAGVQRDSRAERRPKVSAKGLGVCVCVLRACRTFPA